MGQNRTHRHKKKTSPNFQGVGSKFDGRTTDHSLKERRNYILVMLKSIGFNLENRIVINGSIETMKNFIKSGLGFAVLPYYSVYEEIEKGALKVIHNFEKSEDKFQIAYIRENGEKPGISKFVKFVKNYKITVGFLLVFIFLNFYHFVKDLPYFSYQDLRQELSQIHKFPILVIFPNFNLNIHSFHILNLFKNHWYIIK